jgi:hypothetical protein
MFSKVKTSFPTKTFSGLNRVPKVGDGETPFLSFPSHLTLVQFIELKRTQSVCTREKERKKEREKRENKVYYYYFEKKELPPKKNKRILLTGLGHPVVLLSGFASKTSVPRHSPSTLLY